MEQFFFAFSDVVAGLVDSFIYHSSKVLKEKIELGKAGWNNVKIWKDNSETGELIFSF